MSTGAHTALGLLVAVTVLATAPAARADVKLDDAEIQRLVKGELVKRPLPGSGRGSVVAGTSFVLIEAPVDKVWRALNDVSSWTSVFPNTFAARTVHSQGDGRAVKMQLGNRYFTFDFYLTVIVDRESRELTFALNEKKPHDVDEVRGTVRLSPQPGGRTLVAFAALARVPFGPLISLMGDSVVQVLESRVLSVPARLKRWVEGPNGKRYSR